MVNTKKPIKIHVKNANTLVKNATLQPTVTNALTAKTETTPPSATAKKDITMMENPVQNVPILPQPVPPPKPSILANQATTFPTTLVFNVPTLVPHASVPLYV